MVTAAFCIFAVFAGWLEAILYAKRGAESFSSNEHVGMTLMRVSVLLVGLAVGADLEVLGSRILVLGQIIPCALLFPAVHDEAYNFTRLWIDFRSPMTADAKDGDRIAWRLAWGQYDYGYQSPTTTARNDFNGKTRTFFACAGFVILVIIYCAPLFLG